MVSKWAIILTSTLLAFCESAFVDTLQKCAIDDPACLKDLIQNVLRDIGKNGIKEYDIKPVDPIDLKDLKIPILGLLSITVEEGEAKGVKDCVIDNIVSDVNEGKFIFNVTCDISLKVKVRLGEVSPLIQNTFGSRALEGTGNGKVKLDKIHLSVQYFYDIIKKDDGEIYFKCKPEQAVYNYKLGGAKIVTDKVILGNEDISKQVNEFFQQNLQFVINSFGKNIFDVAIGIVSDIVHTFFEKTPAKYFITSDLTPYLKN